MKKWKEIEDKNRMGKTRDIQENWEIKGIFHIRMGMIKEKKDKDLKEEPYI